MINIAFASIMKVVGFEIENANDVESEFGNESEYPNLHNFLRMCVITFRTSIGDLQMPFYKYWSKVVEEHYELGETMVGFIYILWFVIILFNTIVLLNFLISYISESFENVLENNEMSVYLNRCWLNHDRLEYQEFFNLNKEIRGFFITGDFQSRLENEEESQGVIHILKKAITSSKY